MRARQEILIAIGLSHREGERKALFPFLSPTLLLLCIALIELVRMESRLRLVNALEINLRRERERGGKERKGESLDHMFNYENNPNGSA